MAEGTEKPLVWISRAEPGAAETARYVEALGYRPVVAPVLAMENLAHPIGLAGVAALAFTSANGVRAFAAASDMRELPVFTVGDRTADEARMAGFRRVRSAGGDVEALVRLLIEHKPAGLVLHAGTHEPAGDLAGALTKIGIPARHVVIYRAVDAEPTAALAVWEQLSAVLIHSPRAGRALERLMAARAAPQMHAIAISEAAAKPLKHLDLASVAVAPLPNEAKLLTLLTETLPL